ncbi:MAG: tetratricopeptide repeat protein [Bacteroidales bacterium]|nr:tetratricopeptide repeat protein [Bacteroidales bacterium]
MKNITRVIFAVALMIFSISATAQLNKAYFYYQGQKLISQNKFTEAIGYLNTLIDVDSTIAEGWFLRGVAKYYLNDMQGSIRDFSKSISKNQLFTQAYHYRAIVENRLKNYNSALKDLEFALELRPEDQEILFTRGGTYIETSQYSKAIQDYNRVIRYAPNNTESWINRGLARLFSNDTTGAINDLSQAIKLNPFYSESYARRSRVYLDKKEFEMALSDMNQAIYLDSTSTMNYFLRGLIKNAMKSYKGALEDFDKVISIDPSNSLSLYNRALLKSQTGALNSALDDYDRLVKLNPKNVLVFYNRASVNFELGKFNDAINDYTSAITLFPDFANAYINRSVAKSRIGNLKEAEQDYRTATEKIQKYKATSQEAYLAMADTSKKFNSLLSFDTDFSEGFSKINLKNDISLPTGFLPFFKLQLVDEKSKSSFNDYKKPFIEVLNGLTSNGYHFTFTQSNNQNDPTTGIAHCIDTTKSPENIKHFYKALQYSSMNKYNQAVREYQNALKNDPNNLIIALNLAVEQIEMVKFINQFENEVGTISFKMGNLANAQKEKSISANNSYNESISNLKTLETNLPGLAIIPYNIGNTYLLTDELSSAIDEYNKAIIIEPRFSEAWFNRGLVKLIKGEKQNGCLDISKAGELGLNQAYSIIQRFCK